jgi:hypothetical protein
MHSGLHNEVTNTRVSKPLMLFWGHLPATTCRRPAIMNLRQLQAVRMTPTWTNYSSCSRLCPMLLMKAACQAVPGTVRRSQQQRQLEHRSPLATGCQQTLLHTATAVPPPPAPPHVAASVAATPLHPGQQQHAAELLVLWGRKPSWRWSRK